MQIIWGDVDSVIPVSHAHLAHSAMPGSRLEIFRGSGHFPFHDDPIRFLRVVEEFIACTRRCEFDASEVAADADRRRRREHTSPAATSTREAVLGRDGLGRAQRDTRPGTAAHRASG